jgi:hypothetical protein
MLQTPMLQERRLAHRLMPVIAPAGLSDFVHKKGSAKFSEIRRGRMSRFAQFALFRCAML